MKQIATLLIALSVFTACTKKSSTTEPPSPNSSKGWTESEIKEATAYFSNVQLANTTVKKDDLAKCITQKVANTYSHNDYKNTTKDMDEYIIANKVKVTNTAERATLTTKYQMFQKLSDFALECATSLEK